jgi:hypothetical protein
MMIGDSPPRPKCEISTTAAAKTEATPASIALPPAERIWRRRQPRTCALPPRRQWLARTSGRSG